MFFILAVFSACAMAMADPSTCGDYLLSSVCPPKDDIAPCMCGHELQKPTTMMTCANVNSTYVIRSSLIKLRGYSLGRLVFYKVNVSSFPSELFRGVFVDFIDILDSNINSLDSPDDNPPFTGLGDSLTKLRVLNDAYPGDPLPAIRATATNLNFSHLHQLQWLSLTGNYFPLIPSTWFENGPHNLEDVDLIDCKIERLGNAAFANLIKLKRLRLDRNIISEINRQMLPNPALHLEFLDFSSNRLRTLSTDMFENMPRLSHVDLRENFVSTLPEGTWAPVWKPYFSLEIYGNPMVCNAELSWIYEKGLPKVSGLCDMPVQLQGRSIDSLSKKDLSIQA